MTAKKPFLGACRNLECAPLARFGGEHSNVLSVLFDKMLEQIKL